MAKLSIKVVLAGRTYPLTINEDEETKVRSAVDNINASIKRLQESYAVKDMQDLLAMTALQLATRDESSSSMQESSELEDQFKELVESLRHLSHAIGE